MNYQVDFYAKRMHFMEHMLPIWQALGERQGEFFVSPEVFAQCEGREYGPLLCQVSGAAEIPASGRPIVTAAYGDLGETLAADKPGLRRIKIFMEHGAGFRFGNGHPSYAGGDGFRNKVDLFLDTNEYVSGANHRANPLIPNVVIGCPKLDKWHQQARLWQRPEEPVIAIAFHWDCKVAQETRSAYPWFKSALPALAKKYQVIGHAHPRETAQMKREFERMGIEFVADFEEVLRRADLYINDASSTLYEFASAGRPVLVLNAPIYRRHVRFGLRFWEHSEVGVNCNEPAKLLEAVETALQDKPEQQAKRAAAVAAAYPVRGNAAETAVKAIGEFLEAKPLPKLGDYVDPGKPFSEIDGHRIGIVYMAFGRKAALGVEKSVRSLRKLGLEIPVTVVGDTQARGCEFKPWTNASPFDATQRKNFQFRAGRVKPFLYWYSPYDWTLYIDADTEFMRDITPGFLELQAADVALAEEKNPISKLYNKALAGWEVNIKERDFTLEFIGHDEKFINSGVIFFRKSQAAEKLFENWAAEWPRFEQWDEQLALTRAMHQTEGLQVKRLSIDWNHPHRNESRSVVIFHNYGRGDVRSNAGGV